MKLVIIRDTCRAVHEFLLSSKETIWLWYAMLFAQGRLEIITYSVIHLSLGGSKGDICFLFLFVYMRINT